MRKTSWILVIISLIALPLFFQNCGEKLDLGEGELGSQAPTPAPTAAPAIVTQSSNSSFAVNTNQQIFITVANLSNFTVAWRKDGVLLSDSNSTSLVFNPVVASHAGTYVATVTASPNVTLTSTPITVTVTGINQTFSPAVIPFEGQSYYIYTHANDVQLSDKLRDFCRVRIGNSTATSTSHTLLNNTTALNYGRYAMYQNPIYACPVGSTFGTTSYIAIVGNFCLFTYTTAWAIGGITSVTCTP